MTEVFADDVIKLYTEPVSQIQIPALRGIELTIKSGSLVAIIGPSGSGKSTLINVIGGLDKPTAGSILVGETAVEKLRGRDLDSFRRDRVGFLSQSPAKNLLWNLTAFENVLFPMRISGKFVREERLKRAEELLERVGMTARQKSRPGKLSGGEAQRVGLAVALANDPDILLADEPTGELDSVTTFKIIEFLRELNSDLDKTIVVVTHDNRFANMTSLAYRIRDGRIAGLHRAKKSLTEVEGPIIREELQYVDSHGNIRIPEDARAKVGLKTHARVIAHDDHIRIYPADD